MTITAWVLLVCFGLFAFQGLVKFFFGGSLNKFHAIMWFIAIIISSISAGIIWGGLFQ